ncbi:MAG TPA: D-glycero-beta-D-manno-heptose 1-phosphate adenylyltransferase, partial [Pyrinomonadaceae bacterium]|nr:D-glycero-beta-D-manno-heptose 1-phosphate adenylyltransferase [Pyrinomonadaceae bacterium]
PRHSVLPIRRVSTSPCLRVPASPPSRGQSPIGVNAASLLLKMGKIISLEDLLRERQSLRAAGQVVVFTNGVFDLLHVGHVRYLEQARSLGDALIVAINSDRTVRELKGVDRPIIEQEERAEILAAFRAVSYVTVFDDISPRKLIGELLPDVLVKGGDYSLDEIHGRQEVEAAGGRVVSLPFVAGESTSALIERMRR